MKIIAKDNTPLVIKGSPSHIQYFRIEDSVGNLIFSIDCDGVHGVEKENGKIKQFKANEDITKLFVVSITAMVMQHSFVSDHYFSNNITDDTKIILKQLLKSALLLLD